MSVNPPHSIGRKGKPGIKVAWRNIRIISDGAAAYSTPSPLPVVCNDNTAGRGYKLLFDGKTTKGWRGARLDSFPKGGWSVKDGVLTVHESGGGESAHGGDIVTIDKYSNFMFLRKFNTFIESINLRTRHIVWREAMNNN